MPKYNLVNAGGRANPVHLAINEAAAAEVAAEAVESLALTEVNGSPHFAYSATAEDNGTAGTLDGTPGVIYHGNVQQGMRVSARVTLEGGTIAPEAADQVSVGVYKNSTLVATFDNEADNEEYIFDELDAEIIVAEVDCIVDAVAENDVIRVGLIGLGEETVDVDFTPGELSIG